MLFRSSGESERTLVSNERGRVAPNGVCHSNNAANENELFDSGRLYVVENVAGTLDGSLREQLRSVYWPRTLKQLYTHVNLSCGTVLATWERCGVVDDTSDAYRLESILDWTQGTVVSLPLSVAV